eukprot:1489660-Ditylum_brightwellii.AAC.1
MKVLRRYYFIVQKLHPLEEQGQETIYDCEEYCDSTEHDSEEHHDEDKGSEGIGENEEHHGENEGSEGIGEDETSIVQPAVVLDEDSILSDKGNSKNELLECFNCHHRQSSYLIKMKKKRKYANVLVRVDDETGVMVCAECKVHLTCEDCKELSSW